MIWSQKDIITENRSPDYSGNGSSGWVDVKHLAKKNKVSYELYCDRIYKLGWDSVKAATTPKEQQNKKGVEFEGVVDSKVGHCRRYGISLNTVKYHMKKNSVDFVTALRYYL